MNPRSRARRLSPEANRGARATPAPKGLLRIHGHTQERGPISAAADQSLPAWIYSDPAYFDLESQRVFRQAWQVVCHVNDIPLPGDYHTLDFLNERVVAVRGDNGAVRAFHNVCRHRAARVLDGATGNCGRRMVCPYHAWSYGLDGRLIRTPAWQGFE